MYSKTNWRLLLEEQPQSAAVNLAIDEVLTRCVADGRSPPTLRLYQWQSPALVLGRGQQAADADYDALQQAGIILLRRLTGGTAVLNKDALSYSVAVRGDEVRFAGTIAESYRGISLALAFGFNSIGIRNVQAQAMNPELAAQIRVHRSPVCFEIPSYYEIMVDNKKLVGSSQMRIRDGILQHGSLYLDGDIGEISQYLSTHPDPERIRSKTVTLKNALGSKVIYIDCARAIVNGFTEILNVRLDAGALLPWEWIKIEELAKDKYTDPTWTERL